MTLARVWSRALFGSAALLAACGDEFATAPPPAVVRSAVVDPSAGALVARLSVQLDQPAAVEVDYWTTASPRLRVTSAAAALHVILLPRLIANSVYDYQIRTVSTGGSRSQPFQGDFVTDSLPTELATVHLEARGQSTLPLAMLTLSTTPDSGWFAIVDQDGDVVWYRRSAGSPGASTHLPNGMFVLQDFGQGLTAVQPDGRVVANLPQEYLIGPNGPGTGTRIHHDVIATPRNTVLFLARDEHVVGDTTWVGEEIWEWDPGQNTQRRLWSAWDLFSPATDRGPRSQPADWLHANSLAIGPRGNVVVSFHFLDQIISLTSDFRTLEWRLGGPHTTFTQDSSAISSGQHTAAEISPGHVLMFDNGFDRPDGTRYSRALEVELDSQRKTAKEVWEFRPRPDNYARIIGAARRLDNGNTFVAFGTSKGTLSLSTGPIEVYEVTPDHRAVWHLLVTGPSTMYRATPLASIGGETIVDER